MHSRPLTIFLLMMIFSRSLARNYRLGFALRACTKHNARPLSQFVGTASFSGQSAFAVKTKSRSRSGAETIRYLSSNQSDLEIEDEVSKWIKNVVIGLNFCPFAESSNRNKQLFTAVVRGDDVEEILSVVLYESILRKDDRGTTVVVCPDLFPGSFIDFYDTVVMAEHMIKDQDMEGIIQIAPFHPLFQFEGSGEDGVDNLTNRAPYPIFHILREEEVSLAVAKLDGDSSKVWQRNIDLLETMEDKYGREMTNRIMSGEKVEGVGDILRNLKADDGN